MITTQEATLHSQKANTKYVVNKMNHAGASRLGRAHIVYEYKPTVDRAEPGSVTADSQEN